MSGEGSSDGGRRGGVESLPVAVKELIAGGIAGGLAKTAVAPLERVKILFQTRRVEFQSVGLLGSSRKIVQTEGLLGFYRGNGASVARIVPYAALHYMAYEEYRRWIIYGFPDVGRGPVLDLVAGSFAGGSAVILTYPLDLVRTKLAFQVVGSSKMKFRAFSQSEQLYGGIYDCISRIYKQNGIRGLYRGVEAEELVPELHTKDVTVKLVCGSATGLPGQTITYPLDDVGDTQGSRGCGANSLD